MLRRIKREETTREEQMEKGKKTGNREEPGHGCVSGVRNKRDLGFGTP